MVILITAALLIGATFALWFLPRNSRWFWRLLGRAGAAVLFCASMLTLLLFLFGFAACGRYEFPPVPSRDGRLIGQVCEEDCGATDSFHSYVKLWKKRQGPLAWLFGNQANAATVFTVGSDPRDIVLTWMDDRTLLIRYPNDSRDPTEFRCQPQWGTIRIDCVRYSPDSSRPVGEMPPAQKFVW
jgi:hypothetical protein